LLIILHHKAELERNLQKSHLMIRHLSVMYLWVILISVFSGYLSPVMAQGFKDLFKVPENDRPWSIRADALSYDQDASQYRGVGHVVIERGNTRLTADQVLFDAVTNFARAEGAVLLTTGQDQLTCDRIEINLNTEKGTIYKGSIFLADGHFYIRGDKIEKTGTQSYSARKATVTTCDGENPDWKLTTRNLNVTIEGYGTALHSALWVKSIPVMYSPFMAFPVKIKRQTGLLPPHIGTSNRQGFNFDQPFFWAINDSSDMTFNYNYMEKRGNQYGVEYRYLLSPESKGMLMFDWLNDSKVDDGLGKNSKNWGYTDDLYLRPNHDRYWFRMKHDQALPDGYSAKLDLDIVSDQDYLPEFKNSQTGFLKSSEAFKDFFGRDLDDYTDITRRNAINVSKTWTHYNLNAGATWSDHVADRNLDLSNATVQYLPSVNFDGSKHRLASTPLYFTLNSQYTFLYRQDPLNQEKPETGTHRADLYPRFYLPFALSYYLNVEPSFGVRETTWYTAATNVPSGSEEFPDEKEQHRELWDARLDLSNAFYRIYASDWGSIDRIKHEMQPKISYQYLPRVNQDELPHFDYKDRIASMNLITYSLTNIFTYRRQGFQALGENRAESKPPEPVYQQFARLKLEQSYDPSNGRHPYKNLQYSEDGDYTEGTPGDYPFSELYTELEITPANHFSFDTDAKWSFYHKRFTTGNLAFNLWDDRQDRLKLEYRYADQIETISTTEDSVTALESFYATFNLKLTNHVSLFGIWERDLASDTELEYGGGFNYTSQCWALEASHTVEGNDHRYFWTIDLYGLGKLGT